MEENCPGELDPDIESEARPHSVTSALYLEHVFEIFFLSRGVAVYFFFGFEFGEYDWNPFSGLTNMRLHMAGGESSDMRYLGFWSSWSIRTEQTCPDNSLHEHGFQLFARTAEDSLPLESYGVRRREASVCPRSQFGPGWD